MGKLEISDYTAVVSDFDETILSNGRPGELSLHGQSRADALRVVGLNDGLGVLASRGLELNPAAATNASEHTAFGAFWWLLTQCGLVADGSPVDASHPIIKQLVAAKRTSYKQKLTTASEVPGARRFFGLLHQNGFAGRLAIASGAFAEDIFTFFGSHGFDRYFLPQHIIASEDTTRPKPDPEVFIKALAALGIPLAEAPRVLGFEDDPLGIRAAKAIGMFTCAVTTRYSEAQLLDQPVTPDFVAADFNEYAEVFGL